MSCKDGEIIKCYVYSVQILNPPLCMSLPCDFVYKIEKTKPIQCGIGSKYLNLLNMICRGLIPMHIYGRAFVERYQSLVSTVVRR